MKIKKLTLGPGVTNCYVVSDGADAVVIDPGFEPGRVADYLRQKKLRAHYIFLTHGHYDHILGAPALREETGAPIVISAPDADCLVSPLRSLASRAHLPQDAAEADFIAADMSIFVVGGMEFRWLITPGHTPGSAVILCGGAMFSGDTLFDGDCGRCDLPGGSYEDMLASLRRLAALEGDYDVYPGHEGETKLSREREYNGNMREALGI